MDRTFDFQEKQKAQQLAKELLHKLSIPLLPIGWKLETMCVIEEDLSAALVFSCPKGHLLVRCSDVKDTQQKIAETKIVMHRGNDPVSGVYRHYKAGTRGQVGSGLYRLMYLADGDVRYAIYKNIDEGLHPLPWAKPLSKWSDEVQHPETGQKLLRFSLTDVSI